MKRILVVILAVALAGAAALALAQSPSHPTRSSSPLVSIGQPIEPERIGTPPRTGLIEMRAVDPEGGPRRAVLFHRFRRTRGKRRRVLHVCATPGYERELRSRPVPSFGNCTTPEDPRRHQPFLFTSGTGTTPGGGRLPIQMAGLVDRTVTRLVLDGPGGTYEVPRSAHGAYLILYDNDAKGTATLTAHFRDGHTQFHELALPWSAHLPDPGAAKAADPLGRGEWAVSARERPVGTRAGQTCATFIHNRMSRPDVGPPLCGDLRRHRVFATVSRRAPTKRPTGPFGPTPFSLRRVVLWGAVSADVRAVRAAVAGGPARELPLADAGRAFIAVFPHTVDASTVRLEIELADGATQTFTAPDELNVARLREQPRLHGALRIRFTAPHLIEVRTRLTRIARAFRISFLGRPIVMRRVGRSLTYTGVYDRRRGRRRSVRPGRLYGVNVVLCGTEGCVGSIVYARASGR